MVKEGGAADDPAHVSLIGKDAASARGPRKSHNILLQQVNRHRQQHDVLHEEENVAGHCGEPAGGSGPAVLSHRLLDALNPPLFKRAVLITAKEIDASMNDGRLIFVLEIPPSFESNVLAGRQTSLQLNVDATAMAQAGNGAVYIQTIIAQELAKFQAGREGH